MPFTPQGEGGLRTVAVIPPADSVQPALYKARARDNIYTPTERIYRYDAPSGIERVRDGITPLYYQEITVGSDTDTHSDGSTSYIFGWEDKSTDIGSLVGSETFNDYVNDSLGNIASPGLSMPLLSAVFHRRVYNQFVTEYFFEMNLRIGNSGQLPLSDANGLWRANGESHQFDVWAYNASEKKYIHMAAEDFEITVLEDRLSFIYTGFGAGGDFHVDTFLDYFHHQFSAGDKLELYIIPRQNVGESRRYEEAFVPEGFTRLKDGFRPLFAQQFAAGTVSDNLSLIHISEPTRPY